MRKIYNASCIYVCVCVRGVGVRGLFRILLWELFHAGGGGGGVRTPGPTLLLYYNGYMEQDR